MKHRPSPILPLRSLAIAAFVGTAVLVSPAMASSPITLEQLNKAQTEWCERLIEISKASQQGGDAKALAKKKLDELYNFDNGEVLFKPTLTSGNQTFRPDMEGALAYFVGGNAAYPNDTGFALKPFASAKHEIKHFFAKDDVAITMGNVHITDVDGNVITVDKTFGYVLEDGDLKIVLHHSSLPFNPAK